MNDFRTRVLEAIGLDPDDDYNDDLVLNIIRRLDASDEELSAVEIWAELTVKDDSARELIGLREMLRQARDRVDWAASSATIRLDRTGREDSEDER